MTSPYNKSFKISLAVHAVGLTLLFVAGLFRGCSCIPKKQKIDLVPIEFTVAIPEEYLQNNPKDSEPVEEPIKEKEEVKKPDPIPEKVKEKDPDPEPEKVKPPPKPKPEKVPVVKSEKIKVIKKEEKKSPKEIIKLPPNIKPVKITGPKLTPEEIAKLLNMGATVSDHTSIPGENERCLLSIKQALYAAWIRPSSEYKTGRSAEIEITLGSSGAVLKHRLVKSSGNAVLDQSAMDAAAATSMFSHLTPGFLREYPKVTIEFELQ